MKSAKLSQDAMAQMLAARGTPQHRPLVRKLFAEAKQHYGIIFKHKLRCEIDDITSAIYGVLIRKRTGTPYSVADSLVPVYVVAPAVPTYKYSKVVAAEGITMLQSAAKAFGTLLTTVPPGTATWLGTYMADGGLVVPVGGKHYSIPLADALAALAIYGQPVTLDAPPDGHGGALSMGDHLLIPA